MASAELLKPLILDLLQWVEAEDRTYAESIEAWRTSCPRLPVWEDATDRGLVIPGRLVRLSPAGRALLAEKRPARPGAGGPRR